MQIVTSFALSGPAIPKHISRAFEANLSTEGISSIHVVSESAFDSLLAALPLLGHEKVQFHAHGTRPAFDDLVSITNRLLADHPDEPVAILNGDVNFETPRDVARLEGLFPYVHERYAKVALCLTRHDLIFGEPRRTLVTQLGLPNIISTDAWIFREPIDLRFSAYYSQGQIFCDQFFNHDLIESGYRLFNPCLDCVIMHQEEDVKDLQYYSNAAKGSQAQQSVVEHWRRSARYTTGCYYGIAHTSSKALADGYDPAPLLVSKTGRRLMVTFPPNVFAGGAASAAPRYIELASSWDFDLYLLTHTTTEHSELEGLLSRCGGSRAYVFQAENPESVACALMRGLDSHFPNAWLVGHQTHVSADELPTFDTVFVFHDSSPNQGAGLEEAARRLIWTSRLGERTASFLAKCLMHHQPLAVGWASTPEESIRRRAEYNGTFHGKDDT